MGAKLEQYYKFVSDKMGMQARMRLAMKTGVSSTAAKTAPDSPETIEKFRAVIKDLTGADAPRF